MERIAHYHILDRIGAGGMGEVYRARDTRLGRTVAIKVLPDSVAHDVERRARFLREARASAALSHPNICALFEVGEQDDRVYLVFEYVAGETLRHVIGGRPLSVRTALDASIQLADALADAHAVGIVHRDVKPENIIITPKGHPKILDFGLASFTEGGTSRETAATDLKTAEGVALGTVAYMSPEQALGVGYDHRTDIFSLGIVIYEMLTGGSPFKAPTGAAVALRIVQATPPLPSTLNRNVPKELDAIVMRTLAKDPTQRYQTAATLAAELRSVAAILDVREVAELEQNAEDAGTRWTTIAVTIAVLAVAAGVAWFARTPAKALWARWFGPPPAPIIAVMPFDLIGSDQSRLYFADGLTEDVITRLGRVPGVQVLGRSATRNYRGRDPRDVARELNAAVVLAGAVQSDGDQVKVNVELIDPRNGTRIWSDNYQKPLASIFAVQTEIAEDVARRLSVSVASSAVSERTKSRRVDRGAYDLYLRGRDAAARRDVDTAVELYRQALKVDPALAEAHAGLGEALHLRGVFQGRFSAALVDEMRRAAVGAADSDPDLPQAQVALGLTEGSLADALKRFRRAIELDPSYSEAYQQIGDQLMEIDPDRAIAFYRRSVALDPRATDAYADIATVYANEDRFAEAEVEVRRAPQDMAAAARSTFALARKRPQETVAFLEGPGHFLELPGTPGGSTRFVLYISALQQAGEVAKGRAQAESLSKKFPDDCEPHAVLAAFRLEDGDVPGAHALVDRYLAAASAPNASRIDMRCAPMAAAAVADADRAAGFLTRIAENEEYLRYWTLEIMGTSANTWLRRAWFPFDRIADRPSVVSAQAAIARAFVPLRHAAAAILSGLLDRESPSSGVQ